MQRTAEAEQYLKRAIQLEPFTASAHYPLALVYRATRRQAEAQKELAELEHLKEMKERLKQVYQDMRLRPLTKGGKGYGLEQMSGDALPKAPESSRRIEVQIGLKSSQR